jgi:hypothetical protein
MGRNKLYLLGQRHFQQACATGDAR